MKVGDLSITRPSVSKRLLGVALIASFGGLLFGFDTAVIAGTTGALSKIFSLTPAMLGLTVSSALWGTVIGASLSGSLSDRFGRRRCLQILAILYLTSALGCLLAWNWHALLVFRTLSGLAIGSSSVVSPTYITEIAPPRLRGRLVGLFQFNVVLGILLAYCSNYSVGLLELGIGDWRWKFGVAALPALFFLLALLGIPESPRWLIGKGRMQEATAVLTHMGEADAERKTSDILVSLQTGSSMKNEGLFQWRYRLPIFLAITIGIFNQLSGVNAILYYLNSIFERAGFNGVSSNLQAVMIGLTNLVAVTVAMFCIDRIGRRLLLLIGAVGTAICLAGVGVVFQLHQYQAALVWLLVGFIASFSFSQGAVIWVYISEIFPNQVRGKGQALGSFTHWIMNAIVSAVFPFAAYRWGALPFFFFASMMALQFVVVLIIYPETRGVTLEAMENNLHTVRNPPVLR
jgi:MFS transporter, SP family, arabinose:H+ symporter